MTAKKTSGGSGINAAAVTALINEVTGATDHVSRAGTFKRAIIAFGSSLRKSELGKPLHVAIVDDMVARSEAIWRESYAPTKDPAMLESQAKSIKARGSKVRKLYTCAPLLPETFQIDPSLGAGKLEEITMFCTVLVKKEFDVPAALADFRRVPDVDEVAAAALAKVKAAAYGILGTSAELPDDARAWIAAWIHAFMGGEMTPSQAKVLVANLKAGIAIPK